jgi:hypothetical protein
VVLKVPFVAGVGRALGSPGEAGAGKSGKMRKKPRTISSQFKTGLAGLAALLECTGLHYVRCVKPNRSFSTADFGRLRRGPSAILPPSFSFIRRIPIRGTHSRDE